MSVVSFALAVVFIIKLNLYLEDSIWIRADDAHIVGKIYTLQDLKVSDSSMRKDLFP